MKKICKALILCTIFINIIFLGSCEATPNDVTWKDFTHTIYSEMLSKNYNYYYVIFYSADCMHCEDILPYAFKFDKAENTYPLFVVNTDDEFNNYGLMADEGYQYISFIGTENFADVVIEHVPALIIVDHNKVSDLISTQSSKTPKSDIIALLEKK